MEMEAQFVIEDKQIKHTVEINVCLIINCGETIQYNNNIKVKINVIIHTKYFNF
jgi:hypothetical protein